MYWSSKDYDIIAKLIIDIYIDYDITSFPIDEKAICDKLGVTLIPYSSYSEEDREIFLKKSQDGFFAPATIITPPTIFYNDKVTTLGRRRYTIFHELKHFINNDCDDCTYNDNMADYFAKYFMCPVPYIVKTGINNIDALKRNHLISAEVAQYILKNVRNRIAKYNDKIFDYEQPLIDLLCPKILF